jgi:hypothetical protein
MRIRRLLPTELYVAAAQQVIENARVKHINDRHNYT